MREMRPGDDGAYQQLPGQRVSVIDHRRRASVLKSLTLIVSLSSILLVCLSIARVVSEEPPATRAQNISAPNTQQQQRQGGDTPLHATAAVIDNTSTSTTTRTSPKITSTSNKTSDKSLTGTTQIPSFEPPPLSTLASNKLQHFITTSSTTSRPGLIARTSDAIHRTLSGYFSYDDHDGKEDQSYGSKIVTTSTSKPLAVTQTSYYDNKMTTKWPETTTTPRPPMTTIQKRTSTTRQTTTPSPPPPAGLRTSVATTSTTSFLTGWSTSAPRRTTTPSLTLSQGTSSQRPRTSSTVRFVTATPHLDLGTFHDIDDQAPTSTTPAVPGTRSTSRRTSATPTSTATTPTSPSTKTSPIDQEKPARSQTPTLAAVVPVEEKFVPPPEKENSSTQNSTVEFFSFLGQAIKSIYTLSELTALNSAAGNKSRSTRLAPPHNEGEQEGGASAVTVEEPFLKLDEANNSKRRQTGGGGGGRGSSSSDKLVQAASDKQQQQQVAANTNSSARDDILLLCKLLHKHLESSRQNANGSITLTLDGGALAANLTSSPSGGGTTTTLAPASQPQPEVVESSLAGARLISDPQSELSELQHEDRLLESTFALSGETTSTTRNRSYEQAGEELLYDLYNLGHARKLQSRARQRDTAEAAAAAVVASDESSSENIGADDADTSASIQSRQLGNNITLRVWSRTITGGGGGGAGGLARAGRLKLVYWLLERVRIAKASRAASVAATKYKVLDFAEAGELLDQLDHALVQRLIDELGGLVRPIVLVAPHKAVRSTGKKVPSQDSELDDGGVAPPTVIDDSLSEGAATGSGSGGATQSQQNNRTALQLLVDRLTQSASLSGDNLYLYLILFIILLFIIIMCFAVPALCCKCMTPGQAFSGDGHQDLTGSGRRASMGVTATGLFPSSRGRGARGNGQRSSLARAGGEGRRRAGARGAANTTHKSTDPLRESISSISGALAAKAANGNGNGESKQANEGAIWRKLSNSTTTLTQDQVRSLEDNGHLEAATGLASPGNTDSKSKQGGNKFEWYTFEDKQTLRKTTKSSADKPSQTLVVHDQRKVTKSIQTYSRDLLDNENDCTLEQDGTTSGQVATDATQGNGQSADDSFDREHLSLAYRDRLETRNSDTLTKSELVMLKEKLIPIGRELRAQNQTSIVQQQLQQQQVATQPLQQHDYVNTAAVSHQRSPAALPQQQHQVAQPTRHIDSRESIESSGTGNGHRQQQLASDHRSYGKGSSASTAAAAAQERAPSMRYLELPTGVQIQVDAIRGELGRVESRDATVAASQLSRFTPVCHAPPQQGHTATAAAAGNNNPTSDQLSKQQSSSSGAATYRRYDVI